MFGRSFLTEFYEGFLVGGIIFGFLYASVCCDQDEQIEELSSQLKDHELKK